MKEAMPELNLVAAKKLVEAVPCLLRLVDLFINCGQRILKKLRLLC